MKKAERRIQDADRRPQIPHFAFWTLHLNESPYVDCYSSKQ